MEPVQVFDHGTIPENYTGIRKLFAKTKSFDRSISMRSQRRDGPGKGPGGLKTLRSMYGVTFPGK